MIIPQRYIEKVLYLSAVSTLLILTFSSCKTYRFLAYNIADIDDHKRIKSSPLEASDDPYYFYPSTIPFKVDSINYTYQDGGKKEREFDLGIEDFFESSHTVAFLVIQNDTIVYEKYFNKYDTTSIVNSFSTAKSILSLLVGCALDDGILESTDVPIVKYVPELREKGLDSVKIIHLLQMTSGIDFVEKYTGFTDAGNMYYTPDILKEIKKMKPKYRPGTQFHYSSGDSQLLGLVLSRALGDTSLTTYMQMRIWDPLGMEHPAVWLTDDQSMERTFCCIHATARDFAKIGRLYLRQGLWDDKQIVSKDWIEKTTQLDTTGASRASYQYNWYLDEPGSFHTNGYKGQHIYVDENKNLVMVRLGKRKGKMDWIKFFQYVAQSY